MDTTDPTGRERLDDEAIGAFLAREADRRARRRTPSANVVGSIQRGRRRQWPSLTLAGVLAVLAVGIGLVAVALVRAPSDGTGSSPRPSASGPLHLPVVAPGQPCPVSEPTASGPGQPTLLGDGPVRLALASSAGSVFFEATPGGGWKAIDVLWTAEPGLTGDVLVRGARLDGTGELGFGDAADPLKELRLAPGGQTQTFGDRALVATTQMRVKVAGCYGLEIDAGGRSSVVVFEAKPIEDAFAQLERPLQLPPSGPGACAATPTTGSVPFIRLALGDGPVYMAGNGFTITGSRQSGGYWFAAAIWIAAPDEPGPILVRGGRIDVPGDLRFGDGSEPAQELRLPIHSYEHTGGQPPAWRIFNAYVRPPSPGCYAMQLDTLAGSRWLVFRVTG
jgi:hypothetical protein